MSDALSADDRRRLDELFDRAAELPAGDHAAFVARECGANDALRRELVRLLAGLAGEDLLERLRPGAGPGTEAGVGRRIGRYELLERIGEGGMGEVFAAQQRTPVVRRVAVKLIKPGMDSAQVVARFEAERQALARMTHPNVAQVYDGGTTTDGRPYFAMEFVAGDPVTEYCDRRKLSTRARLELFLVICRGVQHAHLKGLIHRDLKPSNLLVTHQDGTAVPKIIDFGIARAITGQLSERTLHTTLGQVLGTLEYMSPEQADPTGVDVDTRSDVYSLGVVLYQLLSGLLPFETRGRSLSELQRAIREQDPPTPSTRLRSHTAQIAPLHGAVGRTLVRELAGDLDRICLKALAKDPARRYQSAADLAEDVRRHLAHEPVLARSASVPYRVRKFVRRHRKGVASGLLVATVGVGAVWGGLRATAAEQRTRVQKPYADAHRAKMLELRAYRELWWPEAATLAGLETWIAGLRGWLDDATQLTSTLDDHRAELRRIEARPAPWSDADQAQQVTLAELVATLESWTEPPTGLASPRADAASRAHGWSVPRRLAFARQMAHGFATGGDYAAAWEAALPRIRAAYPGLALAPQIGLVPILPHPKSKSQLWEFAHLATGAPATRGVDGEIVLAEDTGVVLVLIQGGSFTMGEDGRARVSAESAATSDQLPSDCLPHDVELSAYWLSKFEMTQGQWKRLCGHNPSRYGPDGEWRLAWLVSGEPASLLHPVEQVSWKDCMQWLPRVGLSLPTEAQWEHATRAGTRTAFWPGASAAALQGVANLADGWAMRHGGLEHMQPILDLDDGSTMHAPVGSYRPNAFGLYDVHGNVYEWCRDGYRWEGYASHTRKDPKASAIGDEPRVYRGGSYRSGGGPARSAVRSYYPPAMSGHALGVRPAWVVAR